MKALVIAAVVTFSLSAVGTSIAKPTTPTRVEEVSCARWGESLSLTALALDSGSA
jgi:hypothetical protein